MKKVSVAIAVVLFVAVIATSAFGFGWGRGPGFGFGPCAGGNFQGPAGLDLTAEQKARFKEMRDARFKEMEPFREQMFSKRDELRKLWLESAPDQAKIAAAQKEMRALRDQMQDRMTAFRLESLQVLTPEQREKVKAFAGSRMGGKRGFSPGGAGCFGGGPGGRW